MRQHRQPEVTGIVVNEKFSIYKKELKRFRTTLFQIEKDRLEGKHWGNYEDFIASIQGFANFLAIVNHEKKAEFLDRV